MPEPDSLPAAGSAAPPKAQKSGWVLFAVLLGVYLLIKIQGWAFAYGARTLQRQLEELRPALSAMALSEQLKGTIRSYEEGVRQIRQRHLAGADLLKDFSRLPSSFVLDQVELRPDTLRISGNLLAGSRAPEAALVVWAGTLSEWGSRIRIRKIVPFPEEPGRWQFELQVESRGKR